MEIYIRELLLFQMGNELHQIQSIHQAGVFRTTLLLQNPLFMPPDHAVSQIQILQHTIVNKASQVSCALHHINGAKLLEINFVSHFL